MDAASGMGLQGKVGQPFLCFRCALCRISLLNVPEWYSQSMSQSNLRPVMLRGQTVLFLLFSIIAAASCDKRTPPAPIPSATLNAYRVLYGEIGEQTALSHVYPHKPGLQLDDSAPAGSRDHLIQTLLRLQPQSLQILQLSKQDPGPFPVEPQNIMPDTWPRAWVNRCAEIVQADAGRLWDAGQPDEATARISALIRLGQIMMADSAELMQMWGLARAGAGCIRASAMIDAGLLDKLSTEHKRELLDAVESIRVTDEHTARFDKLAPEVQANRTTVLTRLKR